MRYPFWPVWKHGKDMEMGRKEKGVLVTLKATDPGNFKAKRSKALIVWHSDTVCVVHQLHGHSGVLLSLLHTSPIWLSIQAH